MIPTYSTTVLYDNNQLTCDSCTNSQWEFIIYGMYLDPGKMANSKQLIFYKVKYQVIIMR